MRKPPRWRDYILALPDILALWMLREMDRESRRIGYPEVGNDGDKIMSKEDHEMSHTPITDHGLTKRELFAALAMQGILANRSYEPPRSKRLAGMAKDAVTAADALIAALDEHYAEKPAAPRRPDGTLYTEPPAESDIERKRRTNEEGHAPDCDFLDGNGCWGSTACTCGVHSRSH